MKLEVSLDKLPKNGFTMVYDQEGRARAALCTYEYYNYITVLMEKVAEYVKEQNKSDEKTK